MSFVCPDHKTPLSQQNGTWNCPQCQAFTILSAGNASYTRLLTSASDAALASNSTDYSGEQLNEIYKNFLSWMFRTFKTTDESFRKEILSKLHVKSGDRILITGCGNGNDIMEMSQSWAGLQLEIHAQDLSEEMVKYAAAQHVAPAGMQFVFTVSDATRLPYPDQYFDLVYHFGGINFMPDMKVAIAEMTRVTKDGGQVAFGDEGVAPWLRNTDYGKMMIENNRLWVAETPIQHLPPTANHVNVNWVLENCFYFIDFINDLKFPNVDIDVHHIGPRGGSIRTRYYGKLEGVSDKAKQHAISQAKAAGLGLSEWLEKQILGQS